MRRKFWGWGVEDGGMGDHVNRRLAGMAAGLLGLSEVSLQKPPALHQLELPPSRVGDGAGLDEAIVTTQGWDRASHTYGKSFRDVVRALHGDFRPAPDLAAFPRTEEEVARVLEVCAKRRYALIPYGGGSSVVGGVEPRGLREHFAGIVCLDLSRLNKVLEVDREGLAARVQAGVFGPALEAQLRPHGLTLRHFPQSFEFSSLGGWIATRSAGHFATLQTQIDDFVEAVRVLTPAGFIETRRLPRSGAGPDPNRLFMGSEGTLGVITGAWLRLKRRPIFRAGASLLFHDFLRGAEAVKAIAQSELWPANCRLLDANEARLSGTSGEGKAVLLLGFESADHDLAAWLDRGLAIAREHGGVLSSEPKRSGPGDKGEDAGGEDPASAWRRTFFNGPYLRDVLVRAGLIVETFETACTWDRFPSLHAGLHGLLRDALSRLCRGQIVTCRLTHAYPDGVAPYFTVLAAPRHEDRVAAWDEVKAHVLEAILRLGAAVTHHHAVGRDHRPGYDRECSPLYARSLQAVKRVLDPTSMLNPGVLVDP